MKLSNARIYSFASSALVVWLLIMLEGYWCWFLGSISIRILQLFGFLLIICMTMVLYFNRGLCVTRNRLYLIYAHLLYVLYSVFQLVILNRSLPSVVVKFITLFPFVLILFWKGNVLAKSYVIFRKLMLFFSVGAIFLVVLTVTGLSDKFPYIEILDTGREFYVNQGTAFRVYGFGNIAVSMKSGMFSGFIPRALGPFHEGGHFAIYIGMVVTIDRMLGRRLNPLFLICGIMTFSMAFVILLVISEVLDVIVNKRPKILSITIVAIVAAAVMISLPKDMKEWMKYMLYERNFESVVAAINSSGNLSSGLDERVNASALRSFESFIHSNELYLGTTHAVGNEVMSDYRGLLLNKGIIGFSIILVTLFTLLLILEKRYIVFFLGILLLILLHRSWMYSSCYIQCILLIGAASKFCQSKNQIEINHHYEVIDVSKKNNN